MTAPLRRDDGSAAIVLDLTRLGPGGYCTAAARGLGARVIKVEDPGAGDYARDVRMLDGEGASPAAVSEFFGMLSRGKESVVLDLKSESGRDALLALVERADAMVEAFRPGVLDRLGIGWSVLRERNPQLVLCSISAFGQASPFAGEAAHDINVMGLSGMLAAIAAGKRAGSDRSGPEIVGIQLGDAVAGLTGLAGILAGLVGRAEHGRGSWVDISMYDALLSLPTVEAAELAEVGRVAGAGEGMLDGAFAGYNLYRAADDGWLAVGAFEPKFWRRFCELLERPDWTGRQHDRGAQEELKREVAERIASRPLADWAALFAGQDCCVTPVRGFDEALADEHARSRRLWRGEAGFEQPVPFSFVDGFEALRGGDPPGRGEHTASVLEELGVDPGVVAAVTAARA